MGLAVAVTDAVLLGERVGEAERVLLGVGVCVAIVAVAVRVTEIVRVAEMVRVGPIVRVRVAVRVDEGTSLGDAFWAAAGETATETATSRVQAAENDARSAAMGLFLDTMPVT